MYGLKPMGASVHVCCSMYENTWRHINACARQVHRCMYAKSEIMGRIDHGFMLVVKVRSKNRSG